ncbi:MAG: hypothetical protein WAU07_00320 [Microgenomates group bacterium]
MQKIRAIYGWIKKLPIQFKLFLFAGVLLLFSAILRFITPEVTPESILLPITSGITGPTSLRTVTISGDLPQLPEEVALYQGTNASVSPVEFAAFLASQFGLPKSKDLPNRWVDSTSGISIDYRDYSKQILYLQYFEETEASAIPDREKAIEVSKTFMRDTLGIENITPQITNVQFHGEESVVTQANATHILVPFIFAIDGTQTFYEGARDSYALVYVDGEYRIVKAEFFAPPPNLTQYATAKPLSKNTLERSIKAGNGEIIGSTSVQKFTISDLQNLDIQQVDLEYRYSAQDNRFYPYFRMVGDSETADATIARITLIHPAVELK